MPELNDIADVEREDAGLARVLANAFEAMPDDARTRVRERLIEAVVLQSRDVRARFGLRRTLAVAVTAATVLGGVSYAAAAAAPGDALYPIKQAAVHAAGSVGRALGVAPWDEVPTKTPPNSGAQREGASHDTSVRSPEAGTPRKTIGSGNTAGSSAGKSSPGGSSGAGSSGAGSFSDSVSSGGSSGAGSTGAGSSSGGSSSSGSSSSAKKSSPSTSNGKSKDKSDSSDKKTSDDAEKAKTKDRSR